MIAPSCLTCSVSTGDTGGKYDFLQFRKRTSEASDERPFPMGHNCSHDRGLGSWPSPMGAGFFPPT